MAFVTTVSLALSSGGPVEESLRLEPLTAASREEPAGAAPAARDASASTSDRGGGLEAEESEASTLLPIGGEGGGVLNALAVGTRHAATSSKRKSPATRG